MQPTWLFALSLLVFVILMIRIVRLTPDDTWQAQLRRERFRQRISGRPLPERPSDWLYTHREQKVGLIVLLCIAALYVGFFIYRLATGP